MPRNSSGVYSLPSGNPVVTNTTITSTWANATMPDMGSELTNSLDRSGRGGMLAALKGIDGGAGAPAFSFTNEPNTGLYRFGAGSIALSVLGTVVGSITSTYIAAQYGSDSSTYRPGLRCEGFGASAGSVSSALEFSGLNVNASIWSVRYAAAGGDMVFGTQGNTLITPTERMRLDTNGNLLVGIGVTPAAPNPGLGFIPTGGAYFGNSAGATGFPFLTLMRSGVGIGGITQNGTTGVLFNTTSDRRLKDNIVPAPSASAAIEQLQVRSFTWKSAPSESVAYGFIAQELAQIAPYAVLQGDQGADVTTPWAVDNSRLVPLLVKELQDLRKRVATLETV